jgi:hypothetical protein
MTELEGGTADLAELLRLSEQRRQEVEQDNDNLRERVQALEANQGLAIIDEDDTADAMQRQVKRVEEQKMAVQAELFEYKQLQAAMDNDLARLSTEKQEAVAEAQEGQAMLKHAQYASDALKIENESLLQKNQELEEALGIAHNRQNGASIDGDPAMRENKQFQNMQRQLEQLELEKQTLQKDLSYYRQLQVSMNDNIDRLVQAGHGTLNATITTLQSELQVCQDRTRQAEDEKEFLLKKNRELEEEMSWLVYSGQSRMETASEQSSIFQDHGSLTSTRAGALSPKPRSGFETGHGLPRNVSHPGYALARAPTISGLATVPGIGVRRSTVAPSPRQLRPGNAWPSTGTPAKYAYGTVAKHGAGHQAAGSFAVPSAPLRRASIASVGSVEPKQGIKLQSSDVQETPPGRSRLMSDVQETPPGRSRHMVDMSAASVKSPAHERKLSSRAAAVTGSSPRPGALTKGTVRGSILHGTSTL